MNELRNKLSELIALLNLLRFLIALTSVSSSIDHNLILKASRHLGALNTEFEQRLCYKRQVIVYNQTDRTPAGKASVAILSIAGLTNINCWCAKLYKASISPCFPLLHEFIYEPSAVVLLRSQEALIHHSMLPGAKLSAEHTPLRGVLRKS